MEEIRITSNRANSFFIIFVNIIAIGTILQLLLGEFTTYLPTFEIRLIISGFILFFIIFLTLNYIRQGFSELVFDDLGGIKIKTMRKNYYYKIMDMNQLSLVYTGRRQTQSSTDNANESMEVGGFTFEIRNEDSFKYKFYKIPLSSINTLANQIQAVSGKEYKFITEKIKPYKKIKYVFN
ncbi:MAG: hypothetical protein INQ03_25030 [Candidatus Heimdallarchaeota archaeon]|nr:hypothetical protein [Candidatus Heimdallarchaeota archaeon]